ncbi:hypothetical protein EB093_07590 [bacterium]|nr:hypothetical protein [bacterium]
MPEYKAINMSGLYILVGVIIYNLWNNSSNIGYKMFDALWKCNTTSVVIMLNVIGLYLFVARVKFEITINISKK